MAGRATSDHGRVASFDYRRGDNSGKAGSSFLTLRRAKDVPLLGFESSAERGETFCKGTRWSGCRRRIAVDSGQDLLEVPSADQ